MKNTIACHWGQLLEMTGKMNYGTVSLFSWVTQYAIKNIIYFNNIKGGFNICRK